MASDPTRHGGPRYTRGQRRLLTAVAGLTVAALAGGAFAVTYEVFRDLALAGRVGERWAPLYPAMADTLTALTILSLVVTRNARWWTRLLRWALLLLLVSGGATASVQHAVWGFASLPEDAVRAGVAIAPHVMLVIAVWLWLTMFKQIRVARPGAEAETAPTDRRGHVKVIERVAQDAEPEAASPAPADDPETEQEPLIPFRDAPAEPAEPPAHEAPTYEVPAHRAPAHEPAAHEPAELAADEPAQDEPTAGEPAAREPVAHAQAEPASGADAPAAPEPPAYEAPAGQSLSSEPPPPLDALPEPRPASDTLPDFSPAAPPEPPAPPALLPTDVELVRGRDRDGTSEERPVAATTRPDIVMPGSDGAEEDHDTPPAERAEDPDAGDHPFEAGKHDAPDRSADGKGRQSEKSSGDPADDWNPPPSGSFRSGPTPPVE